MFLCNFDIKSKVLNNDIYINIFISFYDEEGPLLNKQEIECGLNLQSILSITNQFRWQIWQVLNHLTQIFRKTGESK